MAEKKSSSEQSFSDNQQKTYDGSLYGIEGTMTNDFLSGLRSIGRNLGGATNVGQSFGTNIMPLTDPTYRSGFDYARSIAGGMPMSQVIAPGVSYSPEQPMGYTQADLNAMLGETPTPPPPSTGIYFKDGMEPGILVPPSERSVTIFDDAFDKKRMPPLRDIMPPSSNIYGGQIPLPTFGDINDIDISAISKQIADSGIDFTNLFGLPKYETPDLSQFVTKEDLPQIPTGREFSIENIKQNLNLPDFSQFARQEDIPSIPSREDFLSIAREGIDIPRPEVPDVSNFVTQEDINRAIASIDMPVYKAPDLSGYDSRLADLEQGLVDMQKGPTGGRFSINQQRPMGLF